jgi:hypothetical protein
VKYRPKGSVRNDVNVQATVDDYKILKKRTGMGRKDGQKTKKALGIQRLRGF